MQSFTMQFLAAINELALQRKGAHYNALNMNVGFSVMVLGVWGHGLRVGGHGFGVRDKVLGFRVMGL